MSIAQAESAEVALEAPGGLWSDAWQRLRRNPGAISGMVLVAIFVFVAAAGYVIVNLLVDAAYSYLNPRIRVSSGPG